MLGIRDPEKILIPDPDPGVKKAPDPESGFATLPALHLLCSYKASPAKLIRRHRAEEPNLFNIFTLHFHRPLVVIMSILSILWLVYSSKTVFECSHNIQLSYVKLPPNMKHLPVTGICGFQSIVKAGS